MQSTTFFPTSAEAPVFPSFSRSLSKRKLDETFTEEEEAQMTMQAQQQQQTGGMDASDAHVQKVCLVSTPFAWPHTSLPLDSSLTPLCFFLWLMKKANPTPPQPLPRFTL
jgi:hypothetical protein